MKYIRIPYINTLLGFRLCVEIDEDMGEERQELQLPLLGDILVNAMVAHGSVREIVDMRLFSPIPETELVKVKNLYKKQLIRCPHGRERNRIVLMISKIKQLLTIVR